MTPVYKECCENEAWFRGKCENCADIRFRPVKFGKEMEQSCLLIHTETTADHVMPGNSVLGQVFWKLSAGRAWTDADFSVAELLDTLDEALDAVLAGNLILFLDGYAKAVKMDGKGFPSRSVGNAESEKVLRGSNEGFTESVKTNTALIRKRLRTSDLKVEEIRKGVRSDTVIALLYMKDLIRPELLAEVKKRLSMYTVDGILDSGMLEQLAEEHWISPFPQFQTTERPDLAALELLDGKIVALSDNSPAALLLPATLNDFMKVSEDRYHHFTLVSFQRILRYTALVFSLLFSGVYLAVIGFHTQILPTKLLLSFAQARRGVPFPSLLEVLLMELAFELIREAGIRMPGPLSGTIGIVGGLIIGDAAVSANLVSPMTVVIVALSALSSFAIPNEEFASAFRLIKYGFIFLGGCLGMFGIAAGVYLLLGHLAHLTSFQIPYLLPYSGKSGDDPQAGRDGIWRWPLRFLTRRPVYARKDQKIRLRKEEKTHVF